MKTLAAIYRREILSYLTTPAAYVFVAALVFAMGVFTFQIGGFFLLGRADLSAFFAFHPWLFMVFMPAIAMKLWAEETHAGTMEILLTLPAPIWAIGLGKYLAAWTVAAAALALTLPLWVSVNLLGHPDNGAIAIGYFASLFMAGGYLAIGAAMSALSAAQTTAFVLALAVSFALTVAGLPILLDFVSLWGGAGMAEAISGVSILSHFQSAQRGVLEFPAVFYFASLIATFVSLSVLAAEARRG